MIANPTPTQQGETLLPCPFCGGEAEYDERVGMHYIRCVHCATIGDIDVSVLTSSKAKSYELWNTRAAVAGPRGDVVGRMAEHEHVSLIDGIFGGVTPLVSGIRVSVHDILTYLYNGNSLTYIARNYGLSVEAIKDAIAFAQDVYDDVIESELRQPAAPSSPAPAESEQPPSLIADAIAKVRAMEAENKRNYEYWKSIASDPTDMGVMKFLCWAGEDSRVIAMLESLAPAKRTREIFDAGFSAERTEAEGKQDE